MKGCVEELNYYDLLEKKINKKKKDFGIELRAAFISLHKSNNNNNNNTNNNNNNNNNIDNQKLKVIIIITFNFI